MNRAIIITGKNLSSQADLCSLLISLSPILETEIKSYDKADTLKGSKETKLLIVHLVPSSVHLSVLDDTMKVLYPNAKRVYTSTVIVAPPIEFTHFKLS